MKPVYTSKKDFYLKLFKQSMRYIKECDSNYFEELKIDVDFYQSLNEVIQRNEYDLFNQNNGVFKNLMTRIDGYNDTFETKKKHIIELVQKLKNKFNPDDFFEESFIIKRPQITYDPNKGFNLETFAIMQGSDFQPLLDEMSDYTREHRDIIVKDHFWGHLYGSFNTLKSAYESHDQVKWNEYDFDNYEDDYTWKVRIIPGLMAEVPWRGLWYYFYENNNLPTQRKYILVDEVFDSIMDDLGVSLNYDLKSLLERFDLYWKYQQNELKEIEDLDQWNSFDLTTTPNNSKIQKNPILVMYHLMQRFKVHYLSLDEQNKNKFKPLLSFWSQYFVDELLFKKEETLKQYDVLKEHFLTQLR